MPCSHVCHLVFRQGGQKVRLEVLDILMDTPLSAGLLEVIFIAFNMYIRWSRGELFLASCTHSAIT